jgi:prophage regulatory protein
MSKLSHSNSNLDTDVYTGEIEYHMDNREFEERKVDIEFIKLPQVLEIYPVGRTTWLNGVNSGEYPQPYRLGKRIIAWRKADIIKLCEAAPRVDREEVK